MGAWEDYKFGHMQVERDSHVSSQKCWQFAWRSYTQSYQRCGWLHRNKKVQKFRTQNTSLREVANIASEDMLARVQDEVNQSKRITSLPMWKLSVIIMSVAKKFGNYLSRHLPNSNIIKCYLG